MGWVCRVKQSCKSRDALEYARLRGRAHYFGRVYLNVVLHPLIMSSGPLPDRPLMTEPNARQAADEGSLSGKQRSLSRTDFLPFWDQCQTESTRAGLLFRMSH